jgi:hypothetical protein
VPSSRSVDDAAICLYLSQGPAPFIDLHPVRKRQVLSFFDNGLGDAGSAGVAEVLDGGHCASLTGLYVRANEVRVGVTCGSCLQADQGV